MKQLKKWLVRCVPALVLAMAFIIPLAIPARAIVLDYNDFVETETTYVDTNTQLVQCAFPSTNVTWAQYGYPSLGFMCEKGNPGTFLVDKSQFQSDTSYTFISRPFGADAVKVANIPDGSYMRFNMRFYTTSDYSYEVAHYRYVVYYWDDAGVQISSSTGTADIELQRDLTFVMLLDKPDNAYSMSLELYIEAFELYDYDPGATVTFEMVDIGFIVEIDALYRQVMLTGETNDLLENVIAQLEAQGSTLDEIVNGTVVPEAPEGGDAVGDYGDLEGEIMDDMSSNFSDADGYLTSATEIITKYGTALLAVSHLFGIFWRFPFFSELVMVAFAFGMFGTLLGVGFGAISSHNAKVEKAKRQKGKGG